MSDLENYEKISGKNLSPRLRPINEQAIASSGLDKFRKDISSEELKDIIEKNKIERLD